MTVAVNSIAGYSNQQRDGLVLIHGLPEVDLLKLRDREGTLADNRKLSVCYDRFVGSMI
jgi:hypothetical protein